MSIEDLRKRLKERLEEPQTPREFASDLSKALREPILSNELEEADAPKGLPLDLDELSSILQVELANPEKDANAIQGITSTMSVVAAFEARGEHGDDFVEKQVQLFESVGVPVDDPDFDLGVIVSKSDLRLLLGTDQDGVAGQDSQTREEKEVRYTYPEAITMGSVGLKLTERDDEGNLSARSLRKIGEELAANVPNMRADIAGTRVAEAKSDLRQLLDGKRRQRDSRRVGTLARDMQNENDIPSEGDPDMIPFIDRLADDPELSSMSVTQFNKEVLGRFDRPKRGKRKKKGLE